ncbi:UbiA family prenyltransferase [Streptomyces sp. TE12347]
MDSVPGEVSFNIGATESSGVTLLHSIQRSEIIPRIGIRRGLAGICGIIRLRTSVSASALALTVALHDHRKMAAPSFWAGVLIVFLLCAFAQVFNDIVDRNDDAIVKPHRPLPRGVISLKQALCLAWGCAAAAEILAFCMYWQTVVVTLLIIGLCVIYSTFLKDRFPLGRPVTVALSVALSVTVPTIDKPIDSHSIAPLAAAFSFIIGNEMHKIWADREGDRTTQRRTLATLKRDRSAGILLAFCALTTSTAMWQMLAPVEHWRILLLISVALPTTLSASLFLLRSPDRRDQLGIVWRAAWIPGLLAIALGGM